MKKLAVAGLVMALLVGALGQTPATADEPVGAVAPGVQCVGDPPRQTFDPLSPPCVPYFDGDNGCATYGIGVTCDEVKVAIVMDGGINYISGSGAPSSDRNVAPTTRRLYDLWLTKEENNRINNDPESKEEHLTLEGFRVWQEYFNERFQTYGRAVHFYVYYADPNDNTPEKRRINAADIRERINPFGVVSFASEGAEDSLIAALARKGALNFGSFGMRTDEFFSSFPKLIWSFAPSVDQHVTNYGAYLCSSVVGRAPVLAADDIQDRNALPPALGGNNGVRKLGLLSTSDSNHPGLGHAGDLVEAYVQGCAGPGNDLALRHEFPICCLARDNGEVPAYALIPDGGVQGPRGDDHPLGRGAEWELRQGRRRHRLLP